MAGDLGIEEVCVAAIPPEDPAAAARLSAIAAGVGARDLPVVHRYGRLLVVADVSGSVSPDLPRDAGTQALTTLADTATPADVLEDLSDVERLGLEAFELRESDHYVTAKVNRPRQGEPWDMPGCAQRTNPGVPGAGAPTAAGAPAAAPTSAYLEGSVAVGIIIVEGPTAALKFSAAERTKIVAEVQNGLGWYATTNPAAGISFTYDIQVVTLGVAANPAAPDLEAVWRDPAMAQLGYAANFGGVTDYVEHNRSAFGTQWTYCVYFTKYPIDWFAYASIGGPRIVMDYNNDGWGPDNIDRVFAHETGHIFGCPDEYSSSGCTCGGSWGRFGAANGNCQNCASGGGVACLMKGNDFAACRWTPSHLGWGHGISGNPAMVQSRFGGRGNFELVCPSRFSGIDFMWRNNDATGLPWSPPLTFGPDVGAVDALTMIQSNFGSPGNLELIARTGDKLQFFWRDSGPAFKWNGPFQIAAGAAGTPSFIQSRFGNQGNFELVFPSADVGINFMWRNNDAPGLPWSGVSTFGQTLGHVDDVTVIQSNFGSPGNLELIARTGDTLEFFWRDSGPSFSWSGPNKMAAGAGGTPSLIQSRFGNQGNFELVFPSADVGINFMWRNNDAPGLPWSGVSTFGQSLGHVDDVTVIQSNFGSPGNLELIARTGDTLQFFWRDSGPAFRWDGPYRVL
jgi:hypothetical protein